MDRGLSTMCPPISTALSTVGTQLLLFETHYLQPRLVSFMQDLSAGCKKQPLSPLTPQLHQVWVTTCNLTFLRASNTYLSCFSHCVFSLHLSDKLLQLPDETFGCCPWNRDTLQFDLSDFPRTICTCALNPKGCFSDDKVTVTVAVLSSILTPCLAGQPH